MTQRILITGASGTVGSAVVQALEARNIAFSIMRSHPGQTGGKHPVVIGDYNQPGTLREAFQGFDVVFLLQPLVPELVEQGKNAIAAAKAAGVKHVIRSSGAGADPASPFAIAQVHGAVDQALQDSGLHWTILRPTFYMQNHVTHNLGQLKGGAYYAAQGDGAIALIDVRDIADSVAAVLADLPAHDGKIYNLTGGEALSNAQQVRAISEASGKAIQYVDIPPAAAEQSMSQYGIPPTVIQWLLSLHAVVKAGYAAGVSGDVQMLTGHAPRSYADFVREHAAVWK
ncbi:MAG TPA: SDR family oxidoreductase [Rhodocyclaceae bacterium]|nr:SDR family oxidoreductase [Rhodocyclaceae bacterium]